jgi:hypothetical protein
MVWNQAGPDMDRRASDAQSESRNAAMKFAPQRIKLLRGVKYLTTVIKQGKHVTDETFKTQFLIETAFCSRRIIEAGNAATGDR